VDFGALNFADYSADKYRQDVKGMKRMAGDVFQKTFGDEGWNREFLETNDKEINVDTDAAKNLVAAKAREKEFEEKMKGG